jgi:electron transport complex protein RnfA
MAMGVIFVLVMAGTATWLVERYLLKPYNLEFLRTMAFILVIATLVQFVEMFLKKNIPVVWIGHLLPQPGVLACVSSM